MVITVPCTGKIPSIFTGHSKAQIGLITKEADVMSPATFRTMIAGAVMLLTVCDAGLAQSPETPIAAIGPPDARVRGVDGEARRILQRAAEASPTIVRMLADLESSDLIVGVETARLARFLRGEVRVIAATAAVRYLRVRLNVPNGEKDLVAVLGHELRHALEIAGMPDVRDEAGLARAYQRIGTKGRGDGYYETETALEAGRTVAKELGANWPPRVDSTAAAR
jgi:hypothetical protein